MWEKILLQAQIDNSSLYSVMVISHENILFLWVYVNTDIHILIKDYSLRDDIQL